MRMHVRGLKLKLFTFLHDESPSSKSSLTPGWADDRQTFRTQQNVDTN